MTAPAVTVAIPVKNGERYLAASIESVLAQEGVDFAVHVVDNVSDDATVEIARRYLDDPRVSLTVNERDVQYYGSLNRALAAAGTEFFVPFAADDLMLPGSLRARVALLRESGAALVHSRALLIDEEGSVYGVTGSLDDLPAVVAAPDFCRHLVPTSRICCPSVMARTDALRAIGGFDERIVYSADWLAWALVSMRHAVATVPHPLMAYRKHRGSGTSWFMSTGGYAPANRATIRRILDDELFPAELRPHAPVLEAQLLVFTAELAEQHGLRRAADGYASYALLADALELVPGNTRLLADFNAAVERAGLVVPRMPFHAIAETTAEPAELEAAVEHARRLRERSLLERLVVAVPAEEVGDAAGTLSELVADGDELAVELVPPIPEGTDLRGYVALAPFAAPAVRSAEERGVPVVLRDVPDPLAA